MRSLSWTVLYLGIAIFVVGDYCRGLARYERKKPRNWFDPFFGSPVEYYSPKGPFYLTLRRWLSFIGGVMVAAWILFLSRFG